MTNFETTRTAPVDAANTYRRSDVRRELSNVEAAIAEIARGKPVIVVDDEHRENEGDIVFAAEHATTELMAFTIRYSSGYVCVALTSDTADRLALPPMVATNQDPRGTGYAVSVDARDGIGTGISAADRACTARLLAGAATVPHDLTRPGHVVPLRARPGGVLERAGHTEAATDLARLAGLAPAGVLCEIVSEEEPTEMAKGPEVRRFAERHGLQVISIADLIAYRKHTERPNPVESRARTPMMNNTFGTAGPGVVVGSDGAVALVCGDVENAEDVLVYAHIECLLGDVFRSAACDCGSSLEWATQRISMLGRGVIVYIREGGGSKASPSGDAAAGQILHDCTESSTVPISAVTEDMIRLLGIETALVLTKEDIAAGAGA